MIPLKMSPRFNSDEQAARDQYNRAGLSRAAGREIRLRRLRLAHLLRQRADVLGEEGQARQPQGEGGVGERAQTAGGLGNQTPGGGAVGVVIEAQDRSLGGKSPADRRDSDQPVRSG